MKFCINCQHHRVSYTDNLTSHRCHHPSALIETDMVTGTQRFAHCAAMRMAEKRCSEEAKYFLPNSFLPNSFQPLMDIK